MIEWDQEDLKRREELRKASQEVREPKEASTPEEREAQLLAKIRELKEEGDHLRNEIVRLLTEQAAIEERLKCAQRMREERDEDRAEQTNVEWLRYIGLSLLLAPFLSGICSVLVQVFLAGWEYLLEGSSEALYCIAAGAVLLFMDSRRSKQ